MLLSTGCEPTSITEARNQLGRGPLRSVQFTIPVAQDTVTVGELLCPSSSTTPCDTVTTPDGLMGIKIDSQTVGVSVGNQLRFDDVTLNPIVQNVPAGLPPGLYDPPPVNYPAVLDSAPQVQAVDTVQAKSGTLTFTAFNKLPGTVSYTLTLNGFLDGLNNPLTWSGTIPAAPGDGSTTSGTVIFDLTDAKMRGAGTIVVQRLAGSLDPAQTPELVVPVSDSQQIDSTDFDFGDLREAIDSITLNDAQVRLTLSNTSGAPILLSNFVLRTDSMGTAITVPITDPGVSTLTLARGQTGKVVTLQAARLINSVVHQALDGGRPALVAAGTATVGDGAASTITETDEVSAGIGLTVGLDFSLPAAGVTYSQVSAGDGADLGDQDADQIAQRVETASATAIVQNGTPFGVQVRIALVRPTGPNADADTVPTAVTADSICRSTGRVELGPVSLAAATVDAQGRVTTPVLDTATVSITGTQSRVLLGKKFWAAVRVTLLPSGTNTRGAIRTTDQVIIRASGSVRIRTGGTP
ncbi:MAG: hypothetical protein HYV20_10490 [Gemmatimonadetes bacterium]|nr:hypothetical protein [Gemmatimonadota bacterium]